MKLIPPDPEQCQAQHKEGCWPDAQHFMVIGPRQLVRCKNPPTVIAYEKRPGKDGRKGSMSLCNKCLVVFIEQFGGQFATIKPISKSKNYDRKPQSGHGSVQEKESAKRQEKTD